MQPELRPATNAGGAAPHAASVVRHFGRALAGRHWWFTFGMSVFAVIAALLVLTPWISPHDPAALDLRLRMAPPGPEHWLGTDHLGRDVASRLLEGGRFSVSIALLTLILSVGIGTVLGALSARIGGLFDETLMRVVDLLLSFPEVVVALFLIAILGPGYGTLILRPDHHRLDAVRAHEPGSRPGGQRPGLHRGGRGARLPAAVHRPAPPHSEPRPPDRRHQLPALRAQAHHRRRPLVPRPRRPASRSSASASSLPAPTGGRCWRTRGPTWNACRCSRSHRA